MWSSGTFHAFSFTKSQFAVIGHHISRYGSLPIALIILANSRSGGRVEFSSGEWAAELVVRARYAARAYARTHAIPSGDFSSEGVELALEDEASASLVAPRFFPDVAPDMPVFASDRS